MSLAVTFVKFLFRNNLQPCHNTSMHVFSVRKSSSLEVSLQFCRSNVLGTKSGEYWGGGDSIPSVAQTVEALRYKLEGRGFDSRWSHWNF